jgi:hypothetical protein
MGPPDSPVKQTVPAPNRWTRLVRTTHAAVELVCQRWRLRHPSTIAQLRTMARFDGREPCSYRLDRAVNWLPESLPVGFPAGRSACASPTRAAEVVVLSDGAGFALA